MAAALSDWIGHASFTALGGTLLAFALGIGFLGHILRLRNDRANPANPFQSDNQEGYIISGMLGLLALILSFSLVMAVDRFDARRHAVVDEANAIGTAYLRTQLLGEPHRSRISALLVQYTDIRIALATAQREEIEPLLADNDRMLTDLWAATAAAFDSIQNLDFSSTYVQAMNTVVELDVSRKAARLAHVPSAIMVLLTIYIVITAGVLGYVLTGARRQFAGGTLIALLTLWFMLIVDLERPTGGNIQESQLPMQLLRASLMNQPAEVFDRWRGTP
jgi:hypothetical protein